VEEVEEVEEEVKAERKAKRNEELEMAEIRRQKVLVDCVQAWNGFVAGLIKAHSSWERYCRFRLNERINLEEYPLDTQKKFYLANPHGDFSLLVDDQLTRPPIEEFLKSQLVKL